MRGLPTWVMRGLPPGRRFPPLLVGGFPPLLVGGFPPLLVGYATQGPTVVYATQGPTVVYATQGSTRCTYPTQGSTRCTYPTQGPAVVYIPTQGPTVVYILPGVYARVSSLVYMPGYPPWYICRVYTLDIQHPPGYTPVLTSSPLPCPLPAPCPVITAWAQSGRNVWVGGERLIKVDKSVKEERVGCA